MKSFITFTEVIFISKINFFLFRYFSLLIFSNLELCFAECFLQLKLQRFAGNPVKKLKRKEQTGGEFLSKYSVFPLKGFLICTNDWVYFIISASSRWIVLSPNKFCLIIASNRQTVPFLNTVIHLIFALKLFTFCPHLSPDRILFFIHLFINKDFMNELLLTEKLRLNLKKICLS